MISAIIVAAGRGTRINSCVPKQFMEINNKPLLAYTLDKFENCAVINKVVVVANELDLVKAIIKKYSYKKIVTVPGGETRQESVYEGLLTVSEEVDIVLIHDGVRPFVKESDICKVASAAESYGSCALGVQAKDTIKICGEDNRIIHTPNRNELWVIQTPQGFKRSILFEGHKKAKADGFTGTDDVSLVERMGYLSYVVPGSYENIKITTIEDMVYAKWMLSNNLKNDNKRKGRHNNI